MRSIVFNVQFPIYSARSGNVLSSRDQIAYFFRDAIMITVPNVPFDVPLAWRYLAVEGRIRGEVGPNRRCRAFVCFHTK